MAPARLQEDPSDTDDPVTAEYDVYLTPPNTYEQVLLVQHPNRSRHIPYNARHGSSPANVRIKPTTGFLEIDVDLNPAHNFNKYKGLVWGDALSTSREIQNASGTYGPAAGFSGAKPRAAGRTRLNDQVGRENEVLNNLADFHGADMEGKVMRCQTLGGQIIRHDGQGVSEEEKGKPMYFVGAFRDDQLHLTKMDGTVQMRPQFHHLDAEEQRTRLQTSRAAAAGAGIDGGGGAQAGGGTAADARGLLVREKRPEDAGAKEKLEDVHRRILSAAEAEEWVRMEYVDEDDETAYEKFAERMFVREPDRVARLESKWDVWEYLDAVAKPRAGSPVRRRRRRGGRRKAGEGQGEDGDGESEDGEGEDGTVQGGGNEPAG